MSNETPKDKKRGRKPRGGFTNLQELFNCQQPQSALNPNVFLPNTNVDLSDLPWNVTQVPPLSKNHEHHERVTIEQQQDSHITDHEIDNLDMFPNDDFVDYEQVYNIQTNFIKNKNQYNPLLAENGANANADSSIPEHFRIVNLNSSTSTSTSTTTSNVSNLVQQAATVPEYHHPLRVKLYNDDHIRSTNVCVLDDEISWPSSSPFACWWCCHHFTEFPKVIPINLYRSKETGKRHVEVIGNFCTWNCAKAYCIHKVRNVSMFHTFYHYLYGENSNVIIPTPSVLCTKTFGGPLSIEEYRASVSNYNRRVNLQTLNQLHITVAKTFVHDSKFLNRV